VFLLSLEDEQSSRLYFSGIARRQRDHLSIVFAKHIGSDPGSVVEAARRAYDAEFIDEVWCLFDTEGPQHATRRPQARAAVIRARDLGFHCALSNPCFEYWLFLHFENSARMYANCTAVLHHLRDHIPDYDKGLHCFDQLEDTILDAIQRARHNFTTRCDAVGDDVIDCNPSTQVYLLMERLLSD
jgi:RloB-like protein